MPPAQLIEEIVRRVLAESGRTGQGASAAQAPVNQAPTDPAPEVLILSSRDRTDKKAIFRFLPKGACAVYLDQFGRAGADEIMDREFERIILPWLSLKATADLALGRAAGKAAGLALALVMHGQNIGVGEFEYDRFRDTAPPALFRLYRDYEQTLAGFGICRAIPCGDRSRVIHDRLVTEGDMAEFSARGIREITIGPGCLVTALAADMARENRIRIITGSAAGKREA